MTMTRIVLSLLPLLAAAAAFSPSPPRALDRVRAGAGACSGTTRLFSAPPASARSLPEGVSKTVAVEGTGRSVRVGDVVVVKYSCAASSGSGGKDVVPFARSDRQRVVAGDGTMIRGWDAALLSMQEGEKSSFVASDPRFGYGDEGYPPYVPPNAAIAIDLEVLDLEDAVGLGGAGAAMGGDASALDMMDGPASRPRTPGAIAAAYERRMREKELNAPEEKEGIEGFVDWIRNSYFFGLFEGETGQEAPWYLKPSITFPIAFAVVGLAFWVSLAGGAISERGMPTTDELDEIVVSSDMIRTSLAVALSMFQV
ncbi:hypothetical protein ACHAWF_004896 [Thalassiosira exigua]